MRPLSTTARLYIYAVIAAGMWSLCYALPKFTPADGAQFVFFLSTALLAALLKVRLPGVTGSMSVFFLFVLMCVTRLSVGETVVVGGGATILQCFWHARLRPSLKQVLFNVSSTCLAAVAAHEVYHAKLFEDLHFESAIRLGFSSIVFFVLNTGPVAGAIALTEHKPVQAVWRDCYFWCFPYYLLGATTADLFSFLSRTIGWQTSLMVLPVVYVVYRSYHLYLGRLESEKVHAEQMASLHLRTIEALALAIEAKDQTTHDHLQRVQVYAVEMAKVLGLDHAEREAVQAASILHDIGKLAVPEHIVSKPGKLTPEEFEKMKIHPIVGAEILERVQFPYPVVPIVAAHHEKWDGTGYPNGLQGAEIPIGARILAAVDTLDALASDRQYRRALPLDEAMNEVRKLSGKAFDPSVVSALDAHYRDWERLAREGPKLTELAKLSTDVKISRGAEPAAGFEKTAETLPTGRTQPDFLGSIAAARQEVQTLFELAQDLGRSLSLTETLTMMSSRLQTIVRFDALAIYVLGEGTLEPKFVTGADHALFSSLRIPMGQGLSGWVAENRKPIINGNPSVEPGYLNDPSKFSSLHSALAVPLEAGQGVAGVVTLYRSERDAFSKDELRILLAVSSKLSMAVENALRIERAENTATTDFLTGLPNARSLFMHLHEELARAQRDCTVLAVVVCDLDGFKQVNDRFGHLAGNQLLQKIAAALRDHCREYDYVARMGGDEFVVVFPGMTPDDIRVRISELAAIATEAGRQLHGEEIVGLSAGEAYFPADGSDAEALLVVADRRMYKNKAERKEAIRNSTSLLGLASQLASPPTCQATPNPQEH
ncbi:MAG: diguanylate cyclase [Bryobacteraceae bacterium]